MLCNWEKRETKHFSLCACVNSAGQPVSLAILRYLVYQALGLFAADASLVLEHLNIGVLAASKFSRIPRIPPPHSTKKSGGWIPFTRNARPQPPLRWDSGLFWHDCGANHLGLATYDGQRHISFDILPGAVWRAGPMLKWFMDFLMIFMPTVCLL